MDPFYNVLWWSIFDPRRYPSDHDCKQIQSYLKAMIVSIKLHCRKIRLIWEMNLSKGFVIAKLDVIDVSLDGFSSKFEY